MIINAFKDKIFPINSDGGPPSEDFDYERVYNSKKVYHQEVKVLILILLMNLINCFLIQRKI